MIRVEAKKLLNDPVALPSLVLSTVLLGILSWIGFAAAFAPPPAKPAYTHLHCPDCLEEYNYSPHAEKMACPACGQKTTKLVGTVGSFAAGGEALGSVGPGKFIACGILAAVLVQVQVLLLVWRTRVIRGTEAEYRNRALTCRCPFCERKLGFRAHRAGTGASCPRCKTAFFLPTEDVAAVADDDYEQAG